MKFVIEPYISRESDDVYRDDRHYVVKWRFDFLPFWFLLRHHVFGDVRFFDTYNKAKKGIVEFEAELDDAARHWAEDPDLENQPWFI